MGGYMLTEYKVMTGYLSKISIRLHTQSEVGRTGIRPHNFLFCVYTEVMAQYDTVTFE